MVVICYYKERNILLWLLVCAVLSHFSHVSLSATPWTVACQAPLSMAIFSRQEYWSRLPCSPSGDLPDPGIEPRSPALQVDSLLSETPKTSYWYSSLKKFSHEEFQMESSFEKFQKAWKRTLLVGMQTSTATMENSVEISLKTGNRTAIWPSNPTSGHTHRGNQIWKRHMHPNVHRSTVYYSQDMEAT